METYTLGYKFRNYPNRTQKPSSTAHLAVHVSYSTTSSRYVAPNGRRITIR